MPSSGFLIRNRGLLLIILVALSLFFILRFVINLESSMSILLLTLLAILWYSWETRSMKDQIIRQNELAIRPFIVIERDRVGEHRSRIHLTNIGNGPAFNITLEDLDIIDSRTGESLDVKFNNQDLIDEGHSVTVSGADWQDWHLAISGSQVFDFVVRYSDLNNKPYFTSGRLGNNKIVFTGTGAP